MANYFSVDGSFWTDTDVIENFTPEDKYFYLYLLTCVHGNISGCYELSLKQAAFETGYSKESIEHLIERFITVHRMIDYDRETKEVLIHKWGKHHWTTSEKYIVALKKKVSEIKSAKFKTYLTVIVERFINDEVPSDTVWIPYDYGMDTTFLFFNNILSNNTLSTEEDRGMGEEGEPEEVKKPNLNEDAARIVSEWNKTDLLSVVRVSPDSERGKRLRARIKEYGVEDVLKAVQLASESDYLKDQHWFDFGWFVRPENFVKVLEGKYNRNGTGSNQNRGYGEAGRKAQGNGKDFSDLRPSLDPDDESTWGTRAG